MTIETREQPSCTIEEMIDTALDTGNKEAFMILSEILKEMNERMGAEQ